MLIWDDAYMDRFLFLVGKFISKYKFKLLLNNFIASWNQTKIGCAIVENHHFNKSNPSLGNHFPNFHLLNEKQATEVVR